MKNRPVIQKSLVDIENYDMFWENAVSGVVESIYKDAKFFINAYKSNSHKVFVAVCNRLRVVPIDLKATLYAFYKRLNTESADDAPRTA